jgi:hypothetical protein
MITAETATSAVVGHPQVVAFPEVACRSPEDANIAHEQQLLVEFGKSSYADQWCRLRCYRQWRSLTGTKQRASIKVRLRDHLSLGHQTRYDIPCASEDGRQTARIVRGSWPLSRLGSAYSKPASVRTRAYGYRRSVYRLSAADPNHFVAEVIEPMRLMPRGPSIPPQSLRASERRERPHTPVR